MLRRNIHIFALTDNERQTYSRWLDEKPYQPPFFASINTSSICTRDLSRHCLLGDVLDIMGEFGRLGVGLKTEVEAWVAEETEMSIKKGRGY